MNLTTRVGVAAAALAATAVLATAPAYAQTDPTPPARLADLKARADEAVKDRLSQLDTLSGRQGGGQPALRAAQPLYRHQGVGGHVSRLWVVAGNGAKCEERGQYIWVRTRDEDAGSCRQRRQAEAEPGSAGQMPQPTRAARLMP